MEFYQCLVDMVQRNERARGEGLDPTRDLTLRVEERLVCGSSGGVRYSYTDSYALLVPVVRDAATNLDQVDLYDAMELSKSDEQKEHERATGTAPMPVRPRVPLEACLEHSFAEERIDGWRSPATHGITHALKQRRVARYPTVLAIAVERFTFDPVKGPCKMGASLSCGNCANEPEDFVAAPDALDLGKYRAAGRQAHEKELPQEMDEGPQIDETVVQGAFPVVHRCALLS